MKSVSTGAGLCVLGASIFAAALLSSPKVGASASAGNVSVGGTAANRNNVSENRLDGAAKSPRKQEEGFGGAIQQLPCDYPTESWLNPEPRLFQGGECAVGVGPNNMNYADVNQDGTFEYFWFDDGGGAGFRWIVDRQLYGSSEVIRKHFELTPTGPRIRHTKILELGEDVATRLLMLRPGIQFVRVMFNQHGWADCDGDGDLDFVVTLGASGDGVSDLSAIWFENTGMPASQPNRFDLDRDGHVNTADLSLLLMEFTD